MEYKIGTRFKTRGKNPKVYVVIDVWKTYNSKGELVKTRYVAMHDLGAQQVVDRDVCAVTVARGMRED